MRLIYVTLNVLGDAGANAADIFPRLAAAAAGFDKVIVADGAKNRARIRDGQGARFLRMRTKGSAPVLALLNAVRLARVARREQVDVIHVFYRQRNIALVILLRLAMLIWQSSATIVVDHRSVNLAKGWRRPVKMAANLAMQLFAHRLAGNPWAVETNHWVVFRPKHIIDLGYDRLPDAACGTPEPLRPAIWFIGSLRPKNRKSEFLVEVFDRLRITSESEDCPVTIHVAGPARQAQAEALLANPAVNYLGQVPRQDLYRMLQDNPGVGVAFMNEEYHAYAPSLKFCEYAIMRFKIVASDTLGLRTQGERMRLAGVDYVPEDAEAWARALLAAARARTGPMPEWRDAGLWSYQSIFERQVIGLYGRILGKTS